MLPSVDPSSMSSSSQQGWVCARTLSTASRMNRSPFKKMMITETSESLGIQSCCFGSFLDGSRTTASTHNASAVSPTCQAVSCRANWSPSQSNTCIRGSRNGSEPVPTTLWVVVQAQWKPASRTRAEVTSSWCPWG